MEKEVRYEINIKKRSQAEIAQLQKELDKEYEESNVYSHMVGGSAVRKKAPIFYAERYDKRTGKREIKEIEELNTKTKFDILCGDIQEKKDNTIVKFDNPVTQISISCIICKELKAEEIAEMIDYKDSLPYGMRRQFFIAFSELSPVLKEVSAIAEFNAKRDGKEFASAEEYKEVALNIGKTHKAKYIGEVDKNRNKDLHVFYDVKKRTPEEMAKLMLDYEKAVAERKQLAVSGGAYSYDAYLGDIKRPNLYYVVRHDIATGSVSQKDADELDAKQAFNVLFGEKSGSIDRQTTIDKDARNGLYEELNKKLTYSDIQDIMYKVEQTKLPKSVIDDILTPIEKYKEVDTITKYNNKEYSCQNIATTAMHLSMQKVKTKE